MKKNNSLKDFQKIFESLSMKHGHFNVFENFLDCAINSLSFNYNQNIMESIKNKYSLEERHKIGELIKLWIFTCNEQIKSDNCWYDFFGEFYEANAISKQKGFAQYFTPPTICDFMVKILDPMERENIAEPACGSGRFNLSAHAQNPKLFHHANDLDFTCVKMAALNFMIHGIKGVVTCEDTLNVPGVTFRSAFIINDTITPSIHYTEDYIFTKKYINSKLNSRGETFPKIEKLKKLLDTKPLEEIITEELTENKPYREILTEERQLSLF